MSRPTDPTPTDQLRDQIAASLRAAGIEGWESVKVECGAADLRSRITGETMLVDESWTTTAYSNWSVGHERIVALVRAVLAGGWQAKIAALGIVPEIGAMLRYLVEGGFLPSIEKGRDDIWTGHYHRSMTRDVKHCVADTPEEALGMAILTFTASEETTPDATPTPARAQPPAPDVKQAKHKIEAYGRAVGQMTTAGHSGGYGNTPDTVHQEYDTLLAYMLALIDGSHE